MTPNQETQPRTRDYVEFGLGALAVGSGLAGEAQTVIGVGSLLVGGVLVVDAVHRMLRHTNDDAAKRLS